MDTGQFCFRSKFKVLFVFRNDLFRSFGIFYPTFDEQNGDFLVPSVKKVDLKIRKTEKMAKKNNFGHVSVFLSD